VKSSARAWFICRMYGIGQVAILDGGIGKWRAEGRALESGASPDAPGTVTPRRGSVAVRSKADVLANVISAEEQVLDARGAGRFTGAEPEPRPGMPSGHIPGSRNLPFGRMLKPDGTFRDEAGLRAAFAEAGIDVALYDGSWSEWGADPATPKATGPAD